ncbi:hypothetical protein [Amycolatopsis thailandensis]|uniref:hypothetical protein n=1 Tax=Amycolatopsis thailandensis TaxID=589330 RepID=UPI0011782C18|nr:hypothetical protein [Amycolatopsis thailandensis]
MTVPRPNLGSYEHFLDEVAEGRVYVMGLGGVGSAEILVGPGGINAPEFTACRYFYRALDAEDIRVLGAKVFLMRPRHSPDDAPPPV